MPRSEDLDDLIDSYVDDALRATGIRSEGRSRPSPSYAPPIDSFEERASEPEVAEEFVPVPRVTAPTPTGVAALAAELFADEDAPSVVGGAPLDMSAGALSSPARRPAPPPYEALPPHAPPLPVGPSIRFNRPTARPANEPIDLAPQDAGLSTYELAPHGQPHGSAPLVETPPSPLYVMPPLPGLSAAPNTGVPDTLPGIGPAPAKPPEHDPFGADPPTDTDAAIPIAEVDDEPTNVVTKFPP